MPRTALCGMALHPQCRIIKVKGAAYHSTGHSVAWRWTLIRRKTLLRGQQHASYCPLCRILAPSYAENTVEGAAYHSTGHSVAWCCTLSALSDGLEGSLSEGVSVRCRTRPSAVARKRRVSSGHGERGHPRPRQREGPDGYEFCGAGRCRHWEGWSRLSRRNRASTTRIPAAAGGGPSAGRDGSRPAAAKSVSTPAGQRQKKHSEQLAATGPPGEGGGGG